MKVKLIKKKLEKLSKLKYNKKFQIFCNCLGAAFLTIVYFSSPAYAVDTDALAKEISNWAQKLGGLVSFYGALQTVGGFRNDDPGEKSKGSKTFLSGAAIAAVATGYAKFM